MRPVALAACGLIAATPVAAQTSPFAPVPSAPVGAGGSRSSQATGSPPEIIPLDNGDAPGTGGVRGVPGENNPAYLAVPPARTGPIRIPRDP
ncbi:hypothetical protein Q8W71_25725 [Methylobacterium sp. NEAU 140]|uniref:hypothetical protein n=1 Tax=Methylobacterium sp. NEAU 140 TaxID=3064945 RepID=UPI00273709A5|nr:hypothetical protein [Methylobacterium sp. NEAU 140]MDP4026033.1 hypothetical protein [Methylobacterium sp. NEAU 140]